MNFAEGTRFTRDKLAAQSSPYRHLLKPKAGALALTINARGERFSSLVDATIVYPDGIPTFWNFLCGRVPRIAVRARQLPIPEGFATTDYAADPDFRRNLPGSTVVPSAGTLEVAFSPNEGSEALVIKVIESAKTELRVMACSFTSAPVTEALVRAKNAVSMSEWW